MRKYLAVLLVLLAAADSLAVTLTEIAGQLQQPPVLQGSFVQQKHIQILSSPLESSGIFTVVREKGVIWQLQKPLASKVVIDDDGMHGAEVGDNRAMRYIGNILQSILSGDLQKLQQQFDIEAGMVNDQWQLILQPQSALLEKAITAIHLQGDEHIRKLQLFEAGGDRTEIIFHSLSQADTIAPELLHELDPAG